MVTHKVFTIFSLGRRNFVVTHGFSPPGFSPPGFSLLSEIFVFGVNWRFSLHLLPPWPLFSSSITVGNHTLMFPSFPRPAIGSKELFATGLHAAIRQQHDTDCTIHKEPWMLQTPSCKHSVYGLQGLAWQSIDPEPLGESVRTGWWKFRERGWRTIENFFFPLCMWPWCTSPCLHLRVCPHACKESLSCAQVLLKLTVLRPRKCQWWPSISFSICMTFFITFGTPKV